MSSIDEQYICLEGIFCVPSTTGHEFLLPSMYVQLGWIGCAGVMVDVVDAIAQNEAENALVPKLAFFYLVIIPSSVGSERR